VKLFLFWLCLITAFFVGFYWDDISSAHAQPFGWVPGYDFQGWHGHHRWWKHHDWREHRHWRYDRDHDWRWRYHDHDDDGDWR
jgi:hypothetical protein